MQRVRYRARSGIGWIDLDDGKVNVLSPGMQADLHAALDQAVADDVVTVLRGRPGVFSAGFDLGILRGAAGTERAGMVLGGFELAKRVLSHPRPVLIACTGHAVAMGLFLLLSGDYRIGVSSSAKLTANEVAIGLTLPRSAEVLLHQRLAPAAFQRAAILAATFDPEAAVEAGILDEVTEPGSFAQRVEEVAEQLTELDVEAVRATKSRLRAELVGSLTAAIALDRNDFDQSLTRAGQAT